MKEDFDLERQPSSLREYLKETLETLRVCRWVWGNLITNRSRVVGKQMAAISVVMITLTLGSQFAITFVFDGLVEGNTTFLVGGLIAIGLGILSMCLCHWRLGRKREKLAGYLIVDVDTEITKKIFQKSVGQHRQEGSVLNLENIDKARERVIGLGQILSFEGVDALLHLTASLAGLWFISIYYTSTTGEVQSIWLAVFMTAAVASHVTYSLFLNKKVVAEYSPIESAWRKLGRYRAERWNLFDRVKTSGKVNDETIHLASEAEDIRSRDASFWIRFVGLAIGRNGINDLFLYATMCYGSWLVWQGVMTAGILFPIFTWSQYVASNLWQVSRLEHMLNWNLPSVRAMIAALELPNETPDHPDAISLDPSEPVEIEFKEVTYSYPQGSSEEEAANKKMPLPALQKVSFKIRKGERVALLGVSGAGKSTSMHLTLRDMDPDEGKVLVNGVDLRNIQYNSWARKVGYVSQHAQVFDGTIRDNLLYALSSEEKLGIADEELWEVMRDLEIDFGDRLINGLDTRVGKNGMRLSGGEAQRLMIGAAVVPKPQFMLIDEGTSHLDSTKEKKVHQGLIARALRPGVTAMIIAHRLATVRYMCDRFIFLRSVHSLRSGESQIAAIGTSFEDLAEQCEEFAQLVRDQDIKLKTKKPCKSA